MCGSYSIPAIVGLRDFVTIAEVDDDVSTPILSPITQPADVVQKAFLVRLTQPHIAKKIEQIMSEF